MAYRGTENMSFRNTNSVDQAIFPFENAFNTKNLYQNKRSILYATNKHRTHFMLRQSYSN